MDKGHAVTTPATARAIRSMLEMATGVGGTGRAAVVEGYRIGGKTGTARKQVGATYAKNRYRALFVGMAPMSDPRLIVAGRAYSSAAASTSAAARAAKFASITPASPFTCST